MRNDRDMTDFSFPPIGGEVARRAEEGDTRPPNSKRTSGSRTALLILSAFVALPLLFIAINHAVAQPAPARAGFTTSYSKSNILKAVITASTVVPLEGGSHRATNFAFRAVSDGDQTKTEFLVEAPFCTFDREPLRASSPGPVRFTTGNTNFQIAGHGFSYTATNGLLYISNNVVTTILPPSRSGARQPIEIRAKRAFFDQDKKLAIYEDTVRVANNDFIMTSGLLTAAFIDTKTNRNQLSRLEASRDVRLNGTADGSLATANLAVYSVENGLELVELTGQPTWRDAEHESRAHRYVINKQANTLLADGGAWFKLPSASLAQPGLLFATNQIPAATNRPAGFTELAAERVSVERGPTNGPIRHILAESNVVITSTTPASRATADRAEFTDATGDLVLTGDARWRNDESLFAGDLIRVSRDRQAVEAVGHALMCSRLPAGASGDARLTATNLFIEVGAERFNYGDSRAAFSGKSQARLYEGDLLAGVLDGREIRAGFGAARDLQTLEADGAVHAWEIPGGGRTNFLTKELRTEKITVRMTPLRTLQSFTADGGIVTDRTDQSRDGTTNRLRMSSKSAIAYFATNNLVERFFARDDVRMSRNADLVTGSQAVYFATNGLGVLEVSGQPQAFYMGGTMTNAETLGWDQATGKFFARGAFGGSGTVPPSTNNPAAKKR